MQHLVPLVGEVGEGGAADEVVEDEGAGVVRTLPKIERGRTRIRLAVAIMIGNVVMTKRWPVLGNTPNHNCHLCCLSSPYPCISETQGKGPPKPLGRCQCAMVTCLYSLCFTGFSPSHRD